MPLSTPTTKPDAVPSPAATGRPISLPLNAFQRLLRGWEEVHPYNAAQVLELRRPIDVAAASAAWGQTLEEMGLGRVELSRGGYRHVSLNGEMSRYPVRTLPPGTSLESHVSAELNRPFDDAGEPPFRPFILRDVAAATWQFGVVYQHWVADSVAVRLVLRRWTERMFAPELLRPISLRHADAGYLKFSGLAGHDETAAQSLLSLVRRHMRFRRARKVKTFGERDYPVAVVLDERRDLIPRVVESARRRGVKVNDIFLAAAARACDTRIPVQVRCNRPDMALGSIVDLRPMAKGTLDDRFGLFLGFAEVVCRPSEIAAPDVLISTIARQNQMHRKRGVWPSSTGWLILALALRPLVPARKLYSFLRKERPLLAGMSNVNLNGSWVSTELPGLVARYRRISPTGPLAPVVFSVTTLGDDLQLSLTYRSALLSPEQAKDLAQAFLAELSQLA